MADTMESAESTEGFGPEWQDLERTDRIYVRRVVRTGQAFRAGEDHLAAVGARWARYQRARPIQRLWWAWFLPSLLVCLAVGARIHPIVVGIVLAAAAQALVVRRNVKKAASS